MRLIFHEKNKKNIIDSSAINKMPLNKVVNIEKLGNPLNLPMHSLCFLTDTIKDKWTQLDEKCFYVDSEYVLYNFARCNNVIFFDLPIYVYRVGTNEQSMNFTNLIKRREQHEKVCFSCVDFYCKEYNDLTSVKNNTIQQLLKSYLVFHYKILLSLPYRNSKQEIMEFNNKIKNYSISNKQFEKLINKILSSSSPTINAVKYISKNKGSSFRIINLIYRLKFNRS